MLLGHPTLGLLPMTFGTMPVAAGVIAVALVATVFTLFQVPSKVSCPATLNVREDLAFERQKSWTILPEGLAMEAENIRHFKHSWPCLQVSHQPMDGLADQLLDRWR